MSVTCSVCRQHGTADGYSVQVRSFCLIQHCAMEVCKDKEVKLHLFLTSDIVTFELETLSIVPRFSWVRIERRRSARQ